MRLQARLRRPRPNRLLREVRLPRQRLHHRRDRAAALLLQRPAGRLPRLRRPRREAGVRRGPRRPQPRAVDQEGRGRALGQVQPAQSPTTCRSSPASPAPTASTSTLRGRTCPRRRATSSSTAPAASPSPCASSTAGAATRSRSRSRASSATSTAACSRPSPRGCARSSAATSPRSPCEVCHGARLKPEALSVKIAGEDISMSSRRSVADAHAWFGALAAKLSPQHQENRQGDPQGDQRAPRLPPQCRARLSPPRPHQRHALAAARASASASPARSAPASRASSTSSTSPRSASTRRTTTACSRPSSACAASATRCWSSSMTRTRSATPTR